MATTPGLLTDWPWKPLGSFKYVVLAPWVVHSIYSFFMAKKEEERDYTNFMVFPFLLLRGLHNQIWITISRHRTAIGRNRIVDKTIEFDQVDRESNWDDQIILNGLLLYIFNMSFSQVSHLPWWRTDGIILTALIHGGPVEFLYYWLHRALHHHYLYSRYHSHHHSSIVTEPITSVIHPFGEHITYFVLFAIPMLTTVFNGTASNLSLMGYITYIDFMNNMGHCNFELIPKATFSIFPPLKYLMYTPSFHSLHHTQFRTNYSLFMPIYDYIYNTMDKHSDSLYETSLKRQEDDVDVVHLTHLTNPQSMYHIRLGFASFASRPENYYYSKWYLWLMWPITCWYMIINFIYGHTFILERNNFETLKLQTWAIPKYKLQYLLKWQRESTNELIEKAILDAQAKGTKVLSLGLLNQGEELNRYGELYVQRHPNLKIKIVDGSSLVVAIVLHSIPKETTQVLLKGKLNKIALALATALRKRGIQVVTSSEMEYEKLKQSNSLSDLVFSKSFTQKVWLVGDGLTEEDQQMATKGTLFIPFSIFPPKKARKDCFYHLTPSMVCPNSLKNMDSCENWLPRRVISAGRIAGILHAQENWIVNECGDTIFDIEQVWQASLFHGFQPLPSPTILN